MFWKLQRSCEALLATVSAIQRVSDWLEFENLRAAL